MEPELLAILKEAVETQQRKEELERSLGRTLRRHDMGFEAYVKMTSELRELSKKNDTSFEDAAKNLLAEHENDAD